MWLIYTVSGKVGIMSNTKQSSIRAELQEAIDKLNNLTQVLFDLGEKYNDAIYSADQVLLTKRSTDEQIKQARELVDLIETAYLKWQPKGGEWGIYPANMCSEVACGSRPARYRSNKAIAEQAAKELRVFQLLLAYRDEFDPSYQWETGKQNWYVYDIGQNKWKCRCQLTIRVPGVVYMSEQVAKDLCYKLNNGIVELYATN